MYSDRSELDPGEVTCAEPAIESRGYPGVYNYFLLTTLNNLFNGLRPPSDCAPSTPSGANRRCSSRLNIINLFWPRLTFKIRQNALFFDVAS